MATTQLSDVIIPEVYESYTAVDGPELTAFKESGIAVTDAAILDSFASGGITAHLPFWKDLDATVEPNYSTDDPADVAVPDKITAGQMITRLANVNKGFSAADLTGELAGSNPMQRIRNRFGAYWSRAFQRRLLAACKGVIADNVANDASDMVNDISIADGSQAKAENLFSRAAFTGTAFTSGDHFDQYTAIAVHSIVYKRMIDNDDIEYVKDSTGTMSIPTFLGRRVIVDDSMPVAVAGGGYKYTSYLFGPSVIGYGEKGAPVPVEVARYADQGNGGGVEVLWERKTWVIHPFGMSFLSANVVGQSPTLAEMALATNWNRVVERKNVPFAALVTNG